MIKLIFLVPADVTPYQPECQSLDNVISEINQNIAEVPGSSADCVKFADCTGAQCRLTLMVSNLYHFSVAI